MPTSLGVRRVIHIGTIRRCRIMTKDQRPRRQTRCREQGAGFIDIITCVDWRQKGDVPWMREYSNGPASFWRVQRPPPACSQRLSMQPSLYGAHSQFPSTVAEPRMGIDGRKPWDTIFKITISIIGPARWAARQGEPGTIMLVFQGSSVAP